MTLGDLVNKARDCGNGFTTWDIPLLKDGKPFDIDFEAEGSNDEGWHINIIDEQGITEAAKVLVDSVEKYVRQECLRSELLAAKDNLKKLLKE